VTDQADTPDPIGAIRARWSRNGGMGNGRSDEDYTDAGCRILARAAFRDFPLLDAEVRALRAELSACRDWQAKRVVAISQDPMCIRWLRQSEQAEEEAAAAEAERDSALAELAAARDREAALANIARQLMHGLTPKAEAERLILAALSVQSEQPTKGASE
jgi:DNA polymerase III psi subunit